MAQRRRTFDPSGGDMATPYVKPSRKATPPKADHAHEYIRIITHSRVTRLDGSVSAEEYRFALPDECVICGHRYIGRNPKAVEVEVSAAEYRRAHKAARAKVD